MRFDAANDLFSNLSFKFVKQEFLSMDLYEALFTRRSIRKYLADPVSHEDEELILKAGMLAPSACNEQPWSFVCLRDAQAREKASRISPYAHMAKDAPLVIIVCADPALDKADGMWPQDCAAAIENMLLAARGKNIGSVWCGIYPDEERMSRLRDAFGIPASINPFALLCFGHAERGFAVAERFLPDRIHRDKW